MGGLYTPPSIKQLQTISNSFYSKIRSNDTSDVGKMQITQSNREQIFNLTCFGHTSASLYPAGCKWYALIRAKLRGSMSHMIYITVNNWYRHALRFSDDTQVCQRMSHQGTHLQMNYKFPVSPAEVVCVCTDVAETHLITCCRSLWRGT